MADAMSIFTHKYFLAFIITWVICIIIKTLLESFRQKRFTAFSGIKTGGMPSSHSAVVTAITAAIYLGEGASTMFFVSLVFSLIVLNDAFMVRRNVGMQGDALNSLLKKSRRRPIEVVYGHTLLQVLAGMAIGFMVSTAIMLWI